MKILIKILKCIFNPLYMIVTANEENRPIFKHLKKNDIFLFIIAILITAIIILLYYHTYIFGV